MSAKHSRAVPISQTRTAARVGALLGSPAALAFSVVVLVASVGATSTFFAHRALQRAGEQRAEEALRGRADQLRSALTLALSAADPLLDRLAHELRSAEPGASSEPLIAHMRELAIARPGITWISASYPDGRFVGLQRLASGALMGLDSRRDQGAGVERDFAFDAHGVPRVTEQRPSDYDPRTRSFYRLAVERRARAWTAPYPFVPRLDTGISRVLPVYDGPQQRLRAVLTVDFDATGLAALLQRPMTKSERQLVVSADHSVLAASGVALPPFAARSRERALHWADLHDAALQAGRKSSSPHARDGARNVSVAGAIWRLQQLRIGSLDGQPIVLISMVPQAELFAAARTQAWRGALATTITALVGLVLALLLSANIARLRRKRAEAELLVARTQKELAELGSYRLLAPIAKGGMGEVYRARHKLLAREAALKLIRSDEERSESEAELDRARFFDEAKALASLRSVHTVAVYDFGVASDGRYFLAMELLDGLDLDVLVRAHGPQPAARVASILAQICDSLAEAHAAGLVHRDMKPANVFLCRQAEWLDLVKVLDFGLTRRIGFRRGGTVEGTPAYMSPEQALGETVGPAADLYAVGCVGYFLLAGRPPYEAEGTEPLLLAHVSAPVPALPAEVAGKCPPSLVQLLARCLAKTPENRPISAEVLARALRRVASDCAASFSEEARSAFWKARKPFSKLPPKLAAPGEATVPVITIDHDKRTKAESSAT